MQFGNALHHILKFEGGYTNHPDDPGKATNFGITKRTAEQFGYFGEMKEIPIETVEMIYKIGYWDHCKCDLLPAVIRLAVFDGAVNSGSKNSIKWLQEAVYADPDGIIGPETFMAVANQDPYETLPRMIALRIKFLTDLEIFATFGKGWMRRIAEVLRLSTLQ